MVLEFKCGLGIGAGREKDMASKGAGNTTTMGTCLMTRPASKAD